ncbi:MAG: aminopeptidase P family protein [Candidatus Methanomethylicota archaeon]|uniref:Aminopeptidase P family protein n=2 Tax=Thermoproteota archaeon TaxID=2056631 RepID=A0A497FA15_9CREN|nr:MAG: aminopeptidase P family protein [Candidatus Verstraetearchaeota archaeon]
MLSTSTFKDRISAIKRIMEKESIDLMLILKKENFYYFTGFPRGYALLIPSSGEPVLLVPKLEYEEASSSVKLGSVVPVERGVKLSEAIPLELSKVLERGTIGIEEDVTSISLYNALADKLKNFELKFASKIPSRLRAVKCAEEVELIKRALRIAESGVQAAINALKDGVKEVEVAGEAEYAMRKEGAEWFSFETIVASGVRSAYPHGQSSHKRLKSGELVVIDIGAKYGGYCSDITRTGVVDGKMSADALKLMECVNDAIEAALGRISAGVKASDVDAAARKVIVDRGYGEYFIHGLGHGVGLNVHEDPRLSSQSEDILQAGNVVTVEPGIYIPDFGGVRIEEMVLVKEDGYELLNRLSRIIT